MPSKYEKASEAVYELLDGVVRSYHEEHSARGTSFDVLFAFAAEDDEGAKVGPAVKAGGYPANSKTRITAQPERVMGRSDVEITLDGDIWPIMNDEQRKAVLDHAVQRVALRRTITGDPIDDPVGRPKLRFRQYDRHMVGFDLVAARHGDASGVVQQARKLVVEAGQYYFPGFKMPKAAKAIEA